MSKADELIIVDFIIVLIIFNTITAYTQQIIINSSEELLKDPFLPLAERVKKRTETLYHKEESLRGFIKSSTDDTSQVLYLLIRSLLLYYYVLSLSLFL